MISKLACTSAPFSHSSRSLCPSECGRRSTGTRGKPKFRVRRAIRRSPKSGPPPRRCTGILSSLPFTTSKACAPPWAAACAFTAKGESSLLGPPRWTRAICPELCGGENPYAFSGSKTTRPQTRSPSRSAFHSARCARTVTGSESAPQVILISCRSSGSGCRAICSSTSRRRSRRSSSSSIIAASGLTPLITARTSRGARGEMCTVATRKSSLPFADTKPQLYGTSAHSPPPGAPGPCCCCQRRHRRQSTMAARNTAKKAPRKRSGK
mmetsp:Transcript_97652/g.291644  ORF Transcript_97652/g.291644 Transcript_97652/m.291644 type:complete len:267 (+) Transcript_97652:422-1222(+)